MDRLLKVLHENCRLTTKDMAVMLGKTEDEIKTAVAEYEKAGVIRGYKAIVDWENTDREYVSAIIELKVTPKRDRGFDEIATRIGSFPEVKNIYLMSGGYDLHLTIEGRTFQDIALFVAKKLAPLDTVQSTATHFVLKRYKEEGIAFFEDTKDERSIASL